MLWTSLERIRAINEINCVFVELLIYLNSFLMSFDGETVTIFRTSVEYLVVFGMKQHTGKFCCKYFGYGNSSSWLEGYKTHLCFTWILHWSTISLAVKMMWMKDLYSFVWHIIRFIYYFYVDIFDFVFLKM